MSNNGKTILWVDDDVNRMALLPVRDALECAGFDVIAIERVNDFFTFISKSESSIDCVILDILMATGGLDKEDAQNGTRTGRLLYEKIQQSKYKDVKVVVYSVHNKTEFGSFSENSNIEFLSKSMKSSEFVRRITDLIIEKRNRV